MRQVIKHREIKLLKMIRRTDPVIPLESKGKLKEISGDKSLILKNN
jgi:hypothetical protein